MKKTILIASLLLMNSSFAMAEPMLESDIPVRYSNYYIAYDVNVDGSFIETQKWTTAILKESALKDFKKSSVTFRTSVAKGEILEAYTIKKTGQRIDAPKSSYQVTTNDGYNNNSPLYSDETTITVIFPDLTVGDSTVFSYRITNREGIFPNQFSIAHAFSRFKALDDVTITISAPIKMKLRHKSYFLSVQKTVEKEEKQIQTWTYQNKKPEKWTPAESGIATTGTEPSLYVSTFDNYAQIVEAYGKRATPKAAVTERVKILASQISADKPTAQLQARALYDWVAKNISYGGNNIGIGAVVPRDLDVVLDNKMGDCKDHATLLQALLAARNINSEQALVNAGDLYDLPEVPVVSAVNHVINFIPSMNMFVDSTASYVPFGMVPLALGEKPVLLVSHFQEGQKIPATAQYGHEQIMRTEIRINPDGSATGKAEIKLRGEPAINARYHMRRLRGDQEDYAVRAVLKAQGAHGTGTLKKDDPSELLDVYNYSFSVQLEDLLFVASTIGLPIQPVVYSTMSIWEFIKNTYEPTPKKTVRCSGGLSVEEYIYEFPASLRIVGYPKDYTFSSPTIDYKATYRKSGNILTVKRELRDKTASNMCSVGLSVEYNKSARTIMRDIKSQVLISNESAITGEELK